jgi:uncharacterized membrane protein YfcA
MNWELLFYIVLPIIAFLYASVGHGGASGYLALMALFSFSPSIMKPSALVLNILVSLISFTQFKSRVQLNWRLFFFLVLGSIPAAFLGGFLNIGHGYYRPILALLLTIPIVRLFGFYEIKESAIKEFSIFYSLLIGASIGFISGVIGIGGGIILSPLLLLLGWLKFKETSATSALFIAVNSLAGLFGLFKSGSLALFFDMDNVHSHNFLWMLLLALLGGSLGAYFGAKKLPIVALKRILAVVLLMAAIKLVLT